MSTNWWLGFDENKDFRIFHDRWTKIKETMFIIKGPYTKREAEEAMSYFIFEIMINYIHL